MDYNNLTNKEIIEFVTHKLDHNTYKKLEDQVLKRTSRIKELEKDIEMSDDHRISLENQRDKIYEEIQDLKESCSMFSKEIFINELMDKVHDIETELEFGNNLDMINQEKKNEKEKLEKEIELLRSDMSQMKQKFKEMKQKLKEYGLWNLENTYLDKKISHYLRIYEMCGHDHACSCSKYNDYKKLSFGEALKILKDKDNDEDVRVEVYETEYSDAYSFEFRFVYYKEPKWQLINILEVYHRIIVYFDENKRPKTVELDTY
jgi:DNA repair exonuclease SbcCD ATPase subunit